MNNFLDKVLAFHIYVIPFHWFSIVLLIALARMDKTKDAHLTIFVHRTIMWFNVLVGGWYLLSFWRLQDYKTMWYVSIVNVFSQAIVIILWDGYQKLPPFYLDTIIQYNLYILFVLEITTILMIAVQPTRPSAASNG